jgi:hypothetical protein
MVIMSALALMAYCSAGLPTVHLTMEGECVRVIANDDTELDCSVVDLDRGRYHAVRVASDTDVAQMSESRFVVPTGKDAEEIAGH